MLVKLENNALKSSSTMYFSDRNAPRLLRWTFGQTGGGLATGYLGAQSNKQQRSTDEAFKVAETQNFRSPQIGKPREEFESMRDELQVEL